ncbi:MAG: phosphoglucosamine mutase [Candidatus Eremiobacteraeota bacterium]|nr:phosphoglucosamine mutase [Candidatus Eremiobacteraeota bacterium]
MLKFGTDGVRGRFNDSLKVQDVLWLGVAYGHLLAGQSRSAGRPRVVIGRDSRVSGDALQGAFAAGLMSSGVDVVDLGVLPTPAVAFAVRHLKADGAAMLSASHNPVPDNGIKIFNSNGKKLNDEQCRELEALLMRVADLELAQGVAVGRLSQEPSIKETYRRFLLDNLQGSLDGLKIVLDCAHGAAAGHAQEVFEGAGASVVMLCNVPDGEKINVACGSTDLSQLSEAVREQGADMGFAFDGDADRCLSVCDQGREVTGDQMMVVIASDLKEKGCLAGDRVVLTVMSNLGAEKALQAEGIQVARTPVGDRYVFEEMERSGAVLGGEQSGHILLLDRHWSGDGMLAGLVFAGVVAGRGKKVSELVGSIPEMPQKLVNVSGVDRSRLETDPVVAEAIKKAEERLGEDGRLLVRPSGTEPLVRLMAEGSSMELLDSVLAELKETVLDRLGTSAAV